jgi:hypothetical protein
MGAEDGTLGGAGVDPNNSQTQIVTLVGSGRTVLVTGAGDGSVARALADADCSVTVVDDADRLAPGTRDVLKDFVIADLGSNRLQSLFDPASFDVVVLDTVLQGLADPSAAIADARDLLTADGSIVICVPNALFAANRLAVLHGNLPPAQVHAFSGDHLCDLVEDASLSVVAYQATMLDPLDPRVTEVRAEPGGLPPGVVEWVRHQPQALCFQYVVKAQPAPAGQGVARRPRLTQLVNPQVARLADEFTDERLLQEGAEHALLVQRDHVLGLEARTAASAAKQRQAEDRALRLELRAKRLRLELSDLAAAIDKMPRGRGQRTVRSLAEDVRPGRRRND